MIPGLELFLFLEKVAGFWTDSWASAVPGSGKDCPGLIPALALYLLLERIVLLG